MLFGKTKCKPLNFGFDEPIETIQRVDASGKVYRLDCSPSQMSKLDPVADIETNLEVLFRAGVSPQQISVSGLLSPTDPATLERVASDKLSKIASDFSRETSKVNEDISQNSNSNANE